MISRFIIACVLVVISCVVSLDFIQWMFPCLICSDFTGDCSASLSRHSRMLHREAYAANLGPGHSKYERPRENLRRCEVCGIWIGNESYSSHSRNENHLRNQDSLRIREEESRCAADAEGPGYTGDEDDNESRIEMGKRDSSYDDPLDYSRLQQTTDANISATLDWLSRRDDLPFDSHPWIGEVLLSSMKLEPSGHIELARNQNWTYYNRLKIVVVEGEV